MLTAWIGSVCYALQLYFDFSGYSDMAIGLGLIFGIKLPLNFDSPFKATNISDFWRRWHMTMTRFFTSYIYSSLAMAGRRRTGSLESWPIWTLHGRCSHPVVHHLHGGRRLARFRLDLRHLRRHPRHSYCSLPRLA